MVLAIIGVLSFLLITVLFFVWSVECDRWGKWTYPAVILTLDFPTPICSFNSCLSASCFSFLFNSNNLD